MNSSRACRTRTRSIPVASQPRCNTPRSQLSPKLSSSPPRSTSLPTKYIPCFAQARTTTTSTTTSHTMPTMAIPHRLPASLRLRLRSKTHLSANSLMHSTVALQSSSHNGLRFPRTSLYPLSSKHLPLTALLAQALIIRNTIRPRRISSHSHSMPCHPALLLPPLLLPTLVCSLASPSPT